MKVIGGNLALIQLMDFDTCFNRSVYLFSLDKGYMTQMTDYGNYCDRYLGKYCNAGFTVSIAFTIKALVDEKHD